MTTEQLPKLALGENFKNRCLKTYRHGELTACRTQRQAGQKKTCFSKLDPDAQNALTRLYDDCLGEFVNKPAGLLSHGQNNGWKLMRLMQRLS